MSDFLLLEFSDAKGLVETARRAAEAGLAARDALCPNPVEGIEDYLKPPRGQAPIGWIMFIAGALGAVAGYFMQWYSAVIDYPINSGGRPLNSWPAFLLVPYETTILSAGVIGVLGWLWLCGLPRLHHPLFGTPGIERASQDRYFLVFTGGTETSDWLKRNFGSKIKKIAP